MADWALLCPLFSPYGVHLTLSAHPSFKCSARNSYVTSYPASPMMCYFCQFCSSISFIFFRLPSLVRAIVSCDIGALGWASTSLDCVTSHCVPLKTHTPCPWGVHLSPWVEVQLFTCHCYVKYFKGHVTHSLFPPPRIVGNILCYFWGLPTLYPVTVEPG